MKQEFIHKHSNFMKHNLIQSYLKIKNDDNKGGKTIISFFSLNISGKHFTQKITQESFNVISSAKGNELHSFLNYVEDKDKVICDYPFGFTIFTQYKKYVLFASSNFIYKRWIDGLEDLFSSFKIPLSTLSFRVTNSNIVNADQYKIDKFPSKLQESISKEMNMEIELNRQSDIDNNDLMNVFNQIKKDNLILIESSLDTSFSSNESPFENPFNIKSNKNKVKDVSKEINRNHHPFKIINEKDVDRYLVKNSKSIIKDCDKSLQNNIINNKIEKENKNKINEIFNSPGKILSDKKEYSENENNTVCFTYKVDESINNKKKKKVYSSIENIQEELKSMNNFEYINQINSKKNQRKGSEPVKSKLKMELISGVTSYINHEKGISKSIIASEKEFILNIKITDPLIRSEKKGKNNDKM